MVWPSPRVLRALLGLKRALLGLCAWLAMLARALAGLRCLFSLYETTACKQSQQAKRGGLLVLGAHTGGLAYGIEYG